MGSFRSGRIRLYFYPRSPCGERLIVNLGRTATNISIHALLAESDARCVIFCIWITLFLSTLSLRRATFKFTPAKMSSNNFYPRSPCGERHNAACFALPEMIFLSTLSLRRATILGRAEAA